MAIPSVQQLLQQTADRHGSYGGGSAAASACALSAALIEKVAAGKPAARSAKRLRLSCAKLIEADAKVFGSFLRAKQQGNRAAMRRTLKQATGIPSEVEASAAQVLQIARMLRARVSPRYRVDLRCAEELARAARRSAQALVAANRAWSKQFAR